MYFGETGTSTNRRETEIQSKTFDDQEAAGLNWLKNSMKRNALVGDISIGFPFLSSLKEIDALYFYIIFTIFGKRRLCPVGIRLTFHNIITSIKKCCVKYAIKVSLGVVDLSITSKCNMVVANRTFHVAVVLRKLIVKTI